MRTPHFWAPGRGGIVAALLSPVGALYGSATALRLRFKRSWTCPVPIICVGNFVAGGAGKTPVVIDIAARLRARNVKVHVLSRGYGGTATGPLCVSRDLCNARLVGDEPLLLSETAPTWVADNRLSGCKRAVAEKAGLILMDDGFQDPAVVKNLSLVVVDGTYGFGNGRMIPAGPLREPVSSGLARADAVILMGDDHAGIRRFIAGRVPVLSAYPEPGPEAEHLHDRDVLAFAGIAHPGKFFETVRASGPRSLTTRSFPDHHHFTCGDLQRLRDEADALGAVLVTTEKDLVRIPPDRATGIRVLSIHVVWRNEDEITGLLEPIIDDAI